MTLRNLTRQRAVIHVAAQLLMDGFPEEEALHRLDEDQVTAVKALVKIREQRAVDADTAVVPPALQADTDEWQQRRKDLGITK